MARGLPGDDDGDDDEDDDMRALRCVACVRGCMRTPSHTFPLLSPRARRGGSLSVFPCSSPSSSMFDVKRSLRLRFSFSLQNRPCRLCRIVLFVSRRTLSPSLPCFFFFLEFFSKVRTETRPQSRPAQAGKDAPYQSSIRRNDCRKLPPHVAVSEWSTHADDRLVANHAATIRGRMPSGFGPLPVLHFKSTSGLRSPGSAAGRAFGFVVVCEKGLRKRMGAVPSL